MKEGRSDEETEEDSAYTFTCSSYQCDFTYDDANGMAQWCKLMENESEKKAAKEEPLHHLLQASPLVVNKQKKMTAKKSKKRKAFHEYTIRSSADVIIFFITLIIS